jgi:hypothetical protein
MCVDNIFTYGGVAWLIKSWILIGTCIYPLRLQPRQIIFTYNHSFFDSFANNAMAGHFRFLPGPTRTARLVRLARLLALELHSIWSISELDLNWLPTGTHSELSVLNWPTAQSWFKTGTQLLIPRIGVEFATDGQSASTACCRAALWGPWPDFTCSLIWHVIPCKIWGFHGGDYEELCILGRCYKSHTA